MGEGYLEKCPECGSPTLREGESICMYCKSALGTSGSCLIAAAMVGVMLIIALAVGLNIFVG